MTAAIASWAARLGCAALLWIAAHNNGGSFNAAAETPRDAETARGVVRALQQAAIATEAPLRAVELPFRDGARFAAGDLLAAFDCRRQQAELEAARATEREAALNLASQEKLDRHKAVGRLEVDMARARTEKAKAEAASLLVRIDECRIHAPFQGRVVEILLRMHERTTPQRPFLVILDDSRLEVELIVPSGALASLTLGTRLGFAVDELAGREIGLEITALAASVDPVSKTARVITAVRNRVDGLLPGMSGTARLPTDTAIAEGPK